MGNFRPLPTKCWLQFLLLHGYSRERIKGDHFQWTKKNSRPIPVRENYKDVPALHLKTGCFTIGCSLQDLYSWADKNC